MTEPKPSIPGGRPDGTAEPATCGNCVRFGTEAPVGKMPGVGSAHRLCGRPRLDNSAKEWRSPTDWCDQWKGKLADERDHERRRAAAMKGVATRIRNRVEKGVCPCCNRTFVDLQRHMMTKHPEEMQCMVIEVAEA